MNKPGANILGGIVYAMMNSVEMNFIEKEGKRDAVALMKRYGCDSKVALQIMGNIVSVAQGLVNFAKNSANNLGKYSGSEQSSSSTRAPSNSRSSQSIDYQNGANDRDEWERWFATLGGDRREGAEYWAVVRNNGDYPPPTCADGKGQYSDEFRSACEGAKKFLTIVDQGRTSSSEFKAGWNYIESPR